MGLPRPMTMLIFTVCIIVLGLVVVLRDFLGAIVHAISVGVDIAEKSSNNQPAPTPGSMIGPLFHIATHGRFL